MTCQHHLIILSLILPLPSYIIAAQLASKSVSDDHQDAKIVQSTSFEGTETSITNLRPLKPLSTSATHHRHFLARNVSVFIIHLPIHLNIYIFDNIGLYCIYRLMEFLIL